MAPLLVSICWLILAGFPLSRGEGRTGALAKRYHSGRSLMEVVEVFLGSLVDFLNSVGPGHHRYLRSDEVKAIKIGRTVIKPPTELVSHELTRTKCQRVYNQKCRGKKKRCRVGKGLTGLVLGSAMKLMNMFNWKKMDCITFPKKEETSVVVYPKHICSVVSNISKKVMNFFFCFFNCKQDGKPIPTEKPTNKPTAKPTTTPRTKPTTTPRTKPTTKPNEKPEEKPTDEANASFSVALSEALPIIFEKFKEALKKLGNCISLPHTIITIDPENKGKIESNKSDACGFEEMGPTYEINVNLDLNKKNVTVVVPLSVPEITVNMTHKKPDGTREPLIINVSTVNINLNIKFNVTGGNINFGGLHATVEKISGFNLSSLKLTRKKQRPIKKKLAEFLKKAIQRKLQFLEALNLA